jgi:GxxExxY protein
LRTYDAHKYDCARSKHIERIPFLTAKTQRARREQEMNKTKEEIEQIAEQVVDAMLKVHRALGPGLLESTYQTCLAHELRCRGIEVGCEVALPVRYEGIEIEVGYRIDTLVAECIVIENKSVQAILPIHEAQLLTYLKLSGHRLGFLVNWNVPLIKDGIKRMVNKL